MRKKAFCCRRSIPGTLLIVCGDITTVPFSLSLSIDATAAAAVHTIGALMSERANDEQKDILIIM
jgi:hypothetical protein